MMNIKSFKTWFAIAAIGTTASVVHLQPAQAGIFGQKEVTQTDFTLMATPYNSGYSHQLTVLGQISEEQACWEEKGQGPTLIDPLLLNFDFSGICARGVDGNGYSVRIEGEDMFAQYTPKIVEQDGELQLVARPDIPSLPTLLIARSQGPTAAFSKLMFEPGWRITQRTYEDKTLGHFYLTNDQSVAQIANPDDAIAQR